MRVAISGNSGCGNTTATTNVAKALNLSTANYTFRDLAKDLEIDFEFLHKDAPNNAIYDYLTDLKLMRFAINGNVVVGSRLAAWLIKGDLMIWLYASLEARASRINLREREKNNSYEDVLYKTFKRDKQNKERYLQLYGIDIEDHSDFDITINTEKLTAEQVSSLIIAAAQWAQANQLNRKNLHLPRIQSIIAEKLRLPLRVFTDEDFEFDVRDIYKRIKKA